MKAKLDKEFFLKHRFWILLGAIPFLWLMALLVLVTNVAASRDEMKAKYDKQLNQLSGIKDVKTPAFLVPLQKKEQILQGRKNAVWQDLYKSQEGIETWPASSSNARPPKGPFGDKNIDDNYLREYKSRLYFEQLTMFDRINIRPAYYQGGDWRAVIRPVPKWVDKPTVEEAWLAQEDLWVKREILQIVQDAMNVVARFSDVNSFKVVGHEYEQPGMSREGSRLPEGAAAWQMARTPYWELVLVLERKEAPADDKVPPADDPAGAAADPGQPEAAKKAPPVLILSPTKSLIKNIDNDKKERSLEGLVLRLSQRDAQGNIRAEEKVTVEGKPLGWGKTQEIGKEVRVDKFDFKQPIQVEVIEDKSDPLPKGVLARQRFRNATWELELLLEKNPRNDLVISNRSKLRNIHPNRRTLNLDGIRFWVFQREDDRDGIPVQVQGEPVPWGSEPVEIGGNPVPVPTFKTDLVRNPLRVTQELTWPIAPVRRIDDIQLGLRGLSHKDATKPLESKQMEGAPAPVPVQAPVEQPPPSGDEPEAMPNTDPSAADAAGPGGGPATPTDVTLSGLNRKRYYEFNNSNQVRKIPVGLVLVVDQAHVQDVLTAFGNSRLRLLPTQVHWQHIRGVQPPNPEQDRNKAGGILAQNLGAPLSPADGYQPMPDTDGYTPMPDTENLPSNLPGRGGRGPGFKPGALQRPGVAAKGAVSGVASADGDPNLVQLTVYGIASLYERYNSPASPEGQPPP